jgi:hypothetical protein
MTTHGKILRRRRLAWLAATMLAAAVLLGTGGSAHGASPPVLADGSRLGDLARPRLLTVARQCCPERIPMFVNPSRRTLYPGEQVLLSVGDDWLRATLSWEASWASGSLASPGWLSATRGPYVTYTAPNRAGEVYVVVSGSYYGRSGMGTATFFIQP